jgi:hypothetical protein
MFVKINAKLEITGEQRGGYALTVVSSVDQMCIPFKGTKAEEEREDLFEVNADDMIQARFSSETSQLGGMNIPVATLDASADDWVLVKPQEEGATGYVLTVKVSVMERAPKNWFDVGITALGHLPWYLKAEDLYHLTKHVLKEYNISTSRPATELCSLIDHATFVVSNNVLSVRVEEGFSVMGQIDDLLERVFAASDQKVDSSMLELARSLQRLRRAVSRRVEGLSEATQQQLTVLQGKTDEAQEHYHSTVHNAYHWAVERADETSQYLRAEQDGIVGRLNGLTVRGQEVISGATERLSAAPQQAIAKVRTGVEGRIAEARDNLERLPERAHPYVVGAVEASQPYIASALETAGPYVQTLREKAAPVEEWLHGTKDAVEKKYPAVATASQQTTAALEKVVDYCTDGQYYARQQQTAAATPAEETQPAEDTGSGSGEDFSTPPLSSEGARVPLEGDESPMLIL